MTMTESNSNNYTGHRAFGMELAEDDGIRRVYRLSSEDGGASITINKVFQGIELIYYDMGLRIYSEDCEARGRILDINHCLEGRIEYRDREDYYYLSSGDLAISSRKPQGCSHYYPLSHYRGITVRIDLEAAPKNLSSVLADVDAVPTAIYDKFCSERGFYILRDNKSIEHIFSELYDAPQELRRGYYKLKVLELMLFLSHAKPAKISIPSSSLSKVKLAKDAGTYISEHMDVKVTIKELAMHFHVSETQLKNCFKSVYGMSVHAYIVEQKMRAAANDISLEDTPILEIAGKYGFDNGSKFAGAFSRVIGTTPNIYRAKCREKVSKS